jgi:hypothetical protein
VPDGLVLFLRQVKGIKRGAEQRLSRTNAAGIITRRKKRKVGAKLVCLFLLPSLLVSAAKAL